MVEKLKVNTPIAIVGMGISGRATLNLLLSAGFGRSQIAIFDKNGSADFDNDSELLLNFKPKTLVVSPGVPLSLDWIKSFPGTVTNELELASQLLTTEKVICVTGSLGKSTTVSLLDAGLKNFSSSFFVGGNIGLPLAEYANALCIGKKPVDWIVLELSSYQLEVFRNLTCDFSAITFFAPNHLERYRNISHYYETKWSLVDKTRNAVVLNAQSIELVNYANLVNNPKVKFTDRSDVSEEIKLLGTHNKDNFAVAKKLAELAGWPKKSIKGMTDFSGLAHRFENIGTFKGVTYINDSKATTIESVKTAVQSIEGNHLIHLLVGGKDKALPWEQLTQLEAISNLIIYFFGQCGPIAKEKSKLHGLVFEKFEQAVLYVKGKAKSGEIVLLSPGGTSHDEFANFEERGNFFSSLVSK